MKELLSVENVTFSFNLFEKLENIPPLLLGKYYFFVYQDIALILKVDLKLVEKSYLLILVSFSLIYQKVSEQFSSFQITYLFTDEKDL